VTARPVITGPVWPSGPGVSRLPGGPGTGHHL